MMGMKPKVIEDPRFCVVNRQINSNTAKMLVLLPNGEQRLITFCIPHGNCTVVQDLLTQANIPPSLNTKVTLVEDSSPLQINYITEIIGSKVDSHPEDNDDDNDSDDHRTCDNSSLGEVATNSSDSSDIFSTSKKNCNASTMRCEIINDRHQVLESEEEKSRNFEEEIDESRSTADHLSLAEKPSGQSEDYEIRKKTEDSIVPMSTFLTCKAAMLGSYYFVPQGTVIISENGIKMRAPHLEDRANFVSVELKFEDTVRVYLHYGCEIPILFIWAASRAARNIREQLGMHDPRGFYYDSVSGDEKQRRITLLLEIIREESKQVLKTLFQSKKIIEEITSKVAYAILAKATPNNIWPQLKKSLKESKKAIKSTVDNTASKKTVTKVAKRVTELPERLIELPERSVKLLKESTSKVNTIVRNKTRKILVYPPQPGKGGISINTEDYACLNKDEFLNDTIIDFYLKYLTLEILSEAGRNRTHVFSSHFYTRLTSKHQARDDGDVSLTRAAKLHNKVRNWTKDVNIFEKDFILIPIVKNAHWFLTVICFPNLVGKVEANTTMLRKRDAKQNLSKYANLRKKKPLTVATVSENEIRKFPCILIFDSLAGSANQFRVAARLRDYLTYEHLAKIGTEQIFSEQTMKTACPKVPQQFNSSDCGVFVLQYAESFFKDPIEDYTLPIKTLEHWFENIVVTRKRYELKKLIEKLANN